MTFGSFLDKTSVQVGYKLGAVALTAFVVWFSFELRSLWGALSIAAILYLGPIALAAVLLLGAPFYLVYSSFGEAGGWTLIAAAWGMALLNVAIMRWWRASAAGRRSVDDRETDRSQWDRALGSLVFAYAGCGFIVLCYVAGLAALDAVTSGSASDMNLSSLVTKLNSDYLFFLAAFLWLHGLGIAVTGLVVWIVRALHRKPLLRFAVADLALMFSLIALVVLGRVVYSAN